MNSQNRDCQTTDLGLMIQSVAPTELTAVVPAFCKLICADQQNAVRENLRLILCNRCKRQTEELRFRTCEHCEVCRLGFVDCDRAKTQHQL